jgi:hypothetical protein
MLTILQALSPTYYLILHRCTKKLRNLQEKQKLGIAHSNRTFTGDLPGGASLEISILGVRGMPQVIRLPKLTYLCTKPDIFPIDKANESLCRYIC